MKDIARKLIALVGVVLILLSVLMMFGVVKAAEPSTASTQTRATENLQILTDQYPETEDHNHQYFTILWNNTNISLRPSALSHSGSWNAGTDSAHWTMSYDNSTRKLTLSYSNTAGSITVTVTFAFTKNADGADVLLLNASASTTNQTEFNVTVFQLYTGSNSHIDQTLYNEIINQQLDMYYGLSWTASSTSIPYEDHRYIIVQETNGALASEGYPGVGTTSASFPLLYFTVADQSIHAKDNNELHAAFRVLPVRSAPKIGPKILMLNPFANYSRWAIYDNESIYKTAAEYHITHLIIWDCWFQTPSYDFYNSTVEQHIMNIIDYAHKYGIKVGMYFGWRDFTSYGAYHPLLEFNSSALQAAQDSWNTWKAKYYNLVDFIAWDYASTSVTSDAKTWSYWNWYYINQIWRTIHKQIIFNSGVYTTTWYGDRFIPMKVEAECTLSWIIQNKVDNETWAGIFHNFNYPQVWFEKSVYNSDGTYNATLGKLMISHMASHNIMPIPLYYYGSTSGFTRNMDDFKDWKGMMNIYTDIKDAVGNSVQEETEHEIRLLIESSTSQITVTPHVAKLPVRIYTNKTVKIEYEINPSPNIIVKDLTTGATVHWTKGSVIFTATAGHTYEIYDVVQESVNAAYSIVPVMFTLVIVIMVISVIGGMMKAATKGFKGGRGARH